MNAVTATASPSEPTRAWSSLVQRALAWLGQETTGAGWSDASAAMLARADRYEATQPSFAAELRYFAQRVADGK